MTKTGLAEKTTLTAPAPEESAAPTASMPAPTDDAANGSDQVENELHSDVLSIDDADSLASADNDSAVSGISNWSSTATAGSSVYEAVGEHGRTYHRYKQGNYLLPNDETEQERLEIQHLLFGHTFHGKLYFAPIGEPENVLDIATGAGIWAIEFATQHPNTNIIGTDLSAIQPVYVPPNCQFIVDDAEDEWVYSTKFDFIHGRALLSCFVNPKAVFKKAFDWLQPGGYLELQDGIFPMDWLGEPAKESALYRWNQLVVDGAVKMGRSWTNVKYYTQWLKEIGFEDVKEETFYWPINPWPKGEHLKQISMLVQEDLLSSGLEGISMKLLCGVWGWSKEAVAEFLEKVRVDWRNKSMHAYMTVKVVYGRKPKA